METETGELSDNFLFEMILHQTNYGGRIQEPLLVQYVVSGLLVASVWCDSFCSAWRYSAVEVRPIVSEAPHSGSSIYTSPEK